MEHLIVRRTCVVKKKLVILFMPNDGKNSTSLYFLGFYLCFFISYLAAVMPTADQIQGKSHLPDVNHCPLFQFFPGVNGSIKVGSGP